MKLAPCVLLPLVLLAGCEREERHFQAETHNASSTESTPRLSTNQPALPLGGHVRVAEKNISDRKAKADR